MAEPGKDEFLGRLWEAYTALIAGARRRVSQASIAQAIAEGSGQPTRQDDVSRWLRGIGRPSYEELPATAEVLGVRYQWLGFNDGPMTEKQGPQIKQTPRKRPAELEKPKGVRRRGNDRP